MNPALLTNSLAQGIGPSERDPLASILGFPGSQSAFVTWHFNHTFLRVGPFPQDGELLEFWGCVLSPVPPAHSPMSGRWVVHKRTLKTATWLDGRHPKSFLLRCDSSWGLWILSSVCWLWLLTLPLVDMWLSFLGYHVWNPGHFPLGFNQKDGAGPQIPALHPYSCCRVT